MQQEQELPTKHTISVLVDNEPGALSRVIEMFAARGYNIESLSVAEVEACDKLSRITIITSGTDKIIHHIIALLERLVPVHKVKDLTSSSPHIEREVVLLKIITDDAESRIQSLKLADRFGAKTIDSTPKSFVFELVDTSEKILKLIDLMKPYGLAEISKTGVTAISKGKDVL